MQQTDVAIVGAGVAGLCAALQLQEENLQVQVFEASDAVGGRIKTDKVDGFLLDRGFQVFLTAYPEAQRWLNYEALGLKHFDAGAISYYDEKMYSVYDPYRHPWQALRTALVPFAGLKDAFALRALHQHAHAKSIAKLLAETEMSSDAWLRKWNFRKSLVYALIKPFFTGVFLDHELATSSRMFTFLLKMFSEGYASLPEQGMQAIPEQLASRLQPQELHLNTAVTKIEKNKLTLSNGERIQARAIIVATDGTTAARLLNLPQIAPQRHNGTRCLYFSAEKPPIEQPLLVLNGSGNGIVNSLCVPSLVNPNYGTEERDLISVTTVVPTDHLNDEQLLVEVKKELRHWFKKEVRFWDHLRTYTIPDALPFCPTINPLQKEQIKPVLPSIYLAGDYTNYPSMNGAMEAGRLVATTIAWDLALKRDK
jgi:phytoene dehydrogenase-like protein